MPRTKYFGKKYSNFVNGLKILTSSNFSFHREFEHKAPKEAEHELNNTRMCNQVHTQLFWPWRTWVPHDIWCQLSTPRVDIECHGKPKFFTTFFFFFWCCKSIVGKCVIELKIGRFFNSFLFKKICKHYYKNLNCNLDSPNKKGRTWTWLCIFA